MTENEKTIKSLCKDYGINQTALARRFDIPLRTVQDWHAGRRTPPAYVVNMLSDLLERDEKAKEATQGNREEMHEKILDLLYDVLDASPETIADHIAKNWNK